MPDRDIVERARAALDPNVSYLSFRTAQHLIADLLAELERLRQQRTITTVEQLDALPVGAVIRTHAVVYAAEPRPGIQANAWVAIDDRYRHCSDEIVLPATLLWLPEWDNK